VVESRDPGPTGSPASWEGDVETVRLPGNLGYAAGLNAGVARQRANGCDRFLLLNDDAVLEPGSLRRLAEALDDPRLGAVGPVVLRGAGGRLESRGLRIDLRWGRQRLLGHGEPDARAEGRIEVPSLSGAALMVSRAALDRVGPLDEAYFHSFEETDWCVRARREGFALAVVLGARARHAGGRSLGASPERLYYAVRNHLRAAERLLPLGPAAGWARRCSIVALNVAHVLRQGRVPRLAGLRAVARGVADFHRGRFGPHRGAA
jgi:GT2 family glycosyltransferase